MRTSPGIPANLRLCAINGPEHPQQAVAERICSITSSARETALKRQQIDAWMVQMKRRYTALWLRAVSQLKDDKLGDGDDARAVARKTHHGHARGAIIVR